MYSACKVFPKKTKTMAILYELCGFQRSFFKGLRVFFLQICSYVKENTGIAGFINLFSKMHSYSQDNIIFPMRYLGF